MNAYLAFRNIPYIVVTLEVFHRNMSALNCVLSLNSSRMLVTSDTSQYGISTVPAAPQSAP